MTCQYSKWQSDQLLARKSAVAIAATDVCQLGDQSRQNNEHILEMSQLTDKMNVVKHCRLNDKWMRIVERIRVIWCLVAVRVLYLANESRVLYCSV